MNQYETIADFEEENKINIEKVINQYSNYLYSILQHALSNEEDIEELLSDIFLVLWKNYIDLEKEVNVKAYLVGIARNLIKKKYRDSKENLTNIDDFEETIYTNIDMEELIEQNEKSQIISRFISQMKKEEQQIFMMFYYQGKKVKEISKSLQFSETKVKVTLHRLRKSAKKKLKERGYDYGK